MELQMFHTLVSLCWNVRSIRDSLLRLGLTWLRGGRRMTRTYFYNATWASVRIVRLWLVGYRLFVCTQRGFTVLMATAGWKSVTLPSNIDSRSRSTGSRRYRLVKSLCVGKGLKVFPCDRRTCLRHPSPRRYPLLSPPPRQARCGKDDPDAGRAALRAGALPPPIPERPSGALPEHRAHWPAPIRPSSRPAIAAVPPQSRAYITAEAYAPVTST